MGVSRFVIYGGLAVLSIGLLQWTAQDTIKPSPKKLPRFKRSAQVESWVLDSAEASRRFAKPTGETKDMFMPAIKVEREAGATPPTQQELQKVPTSVSGDDGGWVYTGLAQVDGRSLALLENTASHRSGFVMEGEAWKKGRVAHIAVDRVVFLDRDGIERTVLRYAPGSGSKPNPGADTSLAPVRIAVGPGEFGGPLPGIQAMSAPISIGK